MSISQKIDIDVYINTRTDQDKNLKVAFKVVRPCRQCGCVFCKAVGLLPALTQTLWIKLKCFLLPGTLYDLCPWICKACQHWKNEQINRQPGATSNLNYLDNKKKCEGKLKCNSYLSTKPGKDNKFINS